MDRDVDREERRVAGQVPEPLLDHLFRWEGGYVDDPQDPGGETKYGISRRAYPDVDVAALTRADAAAIYHRDYWLSVRGPELPDSVAAVAFDAAVNQGVDAAVRLLQRAVGAVEDGIFGPRTLAAVRRRPAAGIAFDLTVERLLRYAATANFDVYGRGWYRRAVDTYRFATDLLANPRR